MGHKRGKTIVHLEGWWSEAYRADVGWAIGDGQEHGDDPNWDAPEAEQLYSLLEEDIVPCFYKRDDKGIPRSWVARMRTSMAELTPQFSANRMVREYVDKLYSECAKSYRKRSANGVQETVLLCGWYDSLRENWHKLRFGNLDIQRHEDSYVVTVAVYLDDIDSKAIRVQLYAEPVDDAKPETYAMEIARIVSGTGNGYLYSARIPAHQPAEHYTLRIVPYFDGAAVPLEATNILWYVSNACYTGPRGFLANRGR